MTTEIHLNAHRGKPTKLDGPHPDSYYVHTGRGYEAFVPAGVPAGDDFWNAYAPATPAGYMLLQRMCAVYVFSTVSDDTLKADLQRHCRGLHLPDGGTKATLISRIGRAAKG